MTFSFKKFRKSISILLVFCMMFTLMPVNAFALGASDISAHWAEDTIQSWVDNGRIKGYHDGTFKPDNEITRAEFITLVNESFNFTSTAPVSFTDVDQNAWYAAAIAIASEAGYIAGYPDGTMRPDNPISREEAATIIMKINNLEANAEEANVFKDAYMLTWSKGAVGAVVKAGIMNGYPNGSFGPQMLIKRGESVVSLDRAMKHEAAPVTPPAPDVTRNDVTNTVSGMTTLMEYKLDSANYTNYVANAFDDLDFSGNHTLMVRFAVLGINPFGPATTLTFTTSEITSGGSGGSYNAVIAVTGVSLDQATLSLTAGGATGTLVETVNPANATNESVTWTSSNEAVATVVNGVVTPIAAGTATITVTTVDGNFTATSLVTVVPVTLSSIAITTSATKLIYTVGDALDITGMVVTGTYSDASTQIETITTANVTGFDSSVAATSQTLTVTVGGKTTTYTVEIKAIPVTLSSIAITTPATKLIYTVGEALDITGLVVTGTYSDASTQIETITAANVTGFNSSAAVASQTLTVTVGGKTTTYTVEIQAVPVTLSSIAITTPATKLIYTVGEALDITGLVVTGTYSDASTQIETITTANVTGFDSSVAVTSQTLTVTVGGKITTYTVEIQAIPVTLSSIAITTPATKLIYTVGDALDITGMVVTGTYSDASTQIETITTANVTGFDSSIAIASQTLTVTVGGKTTTYTVEIQAVPVTLSSIAITTPATKLIYTVGEALDITGLVVTGTYSDASTQVETITAANVIGFNSTTAVASQTLTVTVSGKTTTYTVEIKAIPVTLSSIAITTPATKLIYTVGDALDITGMVVTGTYSDASTQIETITTANVTGFDSAVAVTSQTLTVTVGGKTTTYTVEIQAIPVTLSSIAITTSATKLIYTVGDALDITGMVVTGTYSDASTQIETITTANVTGFDSSVAVTSQTLTVTVGGKTTTYTVEIQTATILVTGVSLDQATLSLTAGGATGTLVETVAPANATNKTATWSSSNEAVATVANGIVTPIAAGTATITVTTVDGSFIATSEVTVQAAVIAVTGVSLDQATLILTAGGATGTIVETVAPANATNKAVTWSSSNEAVATVANGVVTPIAAGTATITVTTVDGNFTATSEVTVQAATIPVTGVSLDQATLSLTAGGATGTLVETVNPANATNKTVTWSSSNEAVATLANGVVTPLAAGTATITVTTVDGGFTATSEVMVVAPVITGTLSLVGDVLGTKSYQIQLTGAAPEDVTEVLVNGVTKTFIISGGVVRFNAPSTTVVASVQMIVLGQTVNVPTGIITAAATLVADNFGVKDYSILVLGATPQDVTDVLVNDLSTGFEVIAGLVRIYSIEPVTSIKMVVLGQTIEVSLP